MRTPEELNELIHEVVPTLPLSALELLESLGAIGAEAELAQELAQALARLRRECPQPALGSDFADRVLAALPPGLPAALETQEEPAPAGALVPWPAPAARSAGTPGWVGAAAGFLVGVAGALSWAGASAPSALGSSAQAPGAVASRAEPVAPAAQPLERDAPRAREPEPEPKLAPPPASEAESFPVSAQAEPVARGEERAPAERAEDPQGWERRSDPLQVYVSEASVVLEALERLDPSDPRVGRALSLHLEETELLERGERLLIAIELDPSGTRLRPLIRGTQLVLRKVLHAPQRDAAPLSAIRQEALSTGLLDAWRSLLAATPAPEAQARDL